MEKMSSTVKSSIFSITLVLTFVMLFVKTEQSHNGLHLGRISTEAIGKPPSSKLVFAIGASVVETRYRSEDPLQYNPRLLGTKPQTIKVLISGNPNITIATLVVDRYGCEVNRINSSTSQLLMNYSMVCSYETIGKSTSFLFEANLTITFPTIAFNGKRILFQDDSSSNGAFMETKAFIIKYCNETYFPGEPYLAQTLPTGADQQIGNFKGGDFVYVSCSKGLLLEYNYTSTRTRVDVVAHSVPKKCDNDAKWERSLLHCWQGQIVELNRNHKTVEIVDRHVIFVCRNTNGTSKSQVVLRVPNHKPVVQNRIAWVNVTLPVTKQKHPFHVKCAQEETSGNYTNYSSMVYVTSYVKTYVVRLGYKALLDFPIHTRTAVSKNDVRIEKEGKLFKRFAIIHPLHKKHLQALIIEFVPTVTESDIGNYTLTIKVGQREVIKRQLNVVAAPIEEDTSSMAGIIAGTVTSLLLIIAIAVFVCWKLKIKKTPWRSSHRDSMEEALAYDDDLGNNDDVFYLTSADSQRNKSKQGHLELMRKEEEEEEEDNGDKESDCKDKEERSNGNNIREHENGKVIFSEYKNIPSTSKIVNI